MMQYTHNVIQLICLSHLYQTGRSCRLNMANAHCRKANAVLLFFLPALLLFESHNITLKKSKDNCLRLFAM